MSEDCASSCSSSKSKTAAPGAVSDDCASSCSSSKKSGGCPFSSQG
ncbi:MAG: hypothetical protein MK082_12485 [Phycisphaerales bacterium]|nr:hypothetical protein [Phycisphaerales bacterium]